jgi:hypothetical protein
VTRLSTDGNPHCDCGAVGKSVTTQSGAPLILTGDDGGMVMLNTMTEITWCISCSGLRAIATWIARQSVGNESNKPFEVSIYRFGDAK